MNNIILNLQPLSALQLEQLHQYYELLITKAKIMNLTTITEEQEVYIKHFYDSLLVLKEESSLDGKTLLDLGSGAGFPGIVLKIAYPALKVTLLDATQKKCQFLQEVIDTLALKDITVICDRAEHFIKEKHETFDLVVARAVASLNILSELALGFVKKGGKFLAMKGASYQEELNSATSAITILGGKLTNKYQYELPLLMGTRCILEITKEKNTPHNYPRPYAKIKQKPL